MSRPSRRIAWLTVAAVLLAAFAGGYAWYRGYVAQQLNLNVNNWILARTAEGYSIDADIAPESGSWLAATRQLDNIAIAAPRDEWELKLPSLVIEVGTLNPFKVAFHPRGRADIAYVVADVEHRIAATFSGGTAGFTYDKNGRLTSVYIDKLASRIDGPATVEFGSLTGDTKLTGDASASAENSSALFNVALTGANIIRPANLPLGQEISRAEFAGSFSGALQPGRPSESLAAWRDAGGVLQIQRFVANWGPLAVTAEGTLALDGQMQPLFAGTATVRGYGEAIDALAQAGLMPQNQATGAKIALAALAKPAEDGGPAAVHLPLTIQDGFLFVGPLKLARMPRIVWQ